MDDFSWTDGLRAALRPCLSCFATSGAEGLEDAGPGASSNDGANARSRNRASARNDLEGFLREPEETDGDAETWSLHSNVGRQRRNGKKGKRRTKKNGNGNNSFFASLFGRSGGQAIRLPDSDSEDDTDRSPRHPARSLARSNSSSTTSSTLAFDSDAASLDAAAIAKLSAQEALARAEAAARAREEMELAEEDARREKVEARRRRKERRELRRASQLIAMGVEDVSAIDAFEGGQAYYALEGLEGVPPPSVYFTGPNMGAGAGYAPIPADFTLGQQQQPRVRVAANTANSNLLNVPGIIAEEGEHDDESHTDFGGEVYTIKTRKSKSNLRGGVHGSGSDAGSSSSRSSRSHTTSATSTTSISTTSAGADPSTIAYQRFLAMAALNGGQAALAALPSPSTPALSLSPSSPGFYSSAEREDTLPALADPPKRKKKRRPETWIAPSSSSPQTLVFDQQATRTPPARLSPGLGVNHTGGGVQFQFTDNHPQSVVAFNSSLGLEVTPNINLQDGLANAKRKKKNRMSMSGAL